jgi:hypothetical protein
MQADFIPESRVAQNRRIVLPAHGEAAADQRKAVGVAGSPGFAIVRSAVETAIQRGVTCAAEEAQYAGPGSETDSVPVPWMSRAV